MNTCINQLETYYIQYYTGTPQKMWPKQNELIDDALSTAQHAMRTSVHTTLGSSPGTLVLFSHAMFLNVPLLADWHAITQKREHLVNYRQMQQNAQRWRYDYAINQKVLEKVHDPTKLGIRTSGRYNVKQVHFNGTITIQLRPGVAERINIRRVIPFRDDSDNERVTNEDRSKLTCNPMLTY